MGINPILQLDFAATSSIAGDGVDLWLLDLSRPLINPQLDFSYLLSAEELIRAKQYKKNADTFCATRALLRVALAQYTGLDPQKLLFGYKEHGKPFLNNSPVSVYFNLSHCNDVAVLAISSLGEIGVDIEHLNERDYLKIAKRYFYKDELHALHAGTEQEGKILFYKLWTLKEAFFKATGGGIASGLDKVSFQLEKDLISAKFNPVLNVRENEWQFYQEFIASDLLVALAVNSAKAIERQWFDGNALLNNI